MGNSDKPQECSNEHKTTAGQLSPSEVLAQIAPDRAADLKRITTAAGDCKTALPNLAVGETHPAKVAPVKFDLDDEASRKGIANGVVLTGTTFNTITRPVLTAAETALGTGAAVLKLNQATPCNLQSGELSAKGPVHTDTVATGLQADRTKVDGRSTPTVGGGELLTAAKIEPQRTASGNPPVEVCSTASQTRPGVSTSRIEAAATIAGFSEAVIRTDVSNEAVVRTAASGEAVIRTAASGEAVILGSGTNGQTGITNTQIEWALRTEIPLGTHSGPLGTVISPVFRVPNNDIAVPPTTGIVTRSDTIVTGSLSPTAHNEMAVRAPIEQIVPPGSITQPVVQASFSERVLSVTKTEPALPASLIEAVLPATISQPLPSTLATLLTAGTPDHPIADRSIADRPITDRPVIERPIVESGGDPSVARPVVSQLVPNTDALTGIANPDQSIHSARFQPVQPGALTDPAQESLHAPGRQDRQQVAEQLVPPRLPTEAPRLEAPPPRLAAEPPHTVADYAALSPRPTLVENIRLATADMAEVVHRTPVGFTLTNSYEEPAGHHNHHVLVNRDQPTLTGDGRHLVAQSHNAGQQPIYIADQPKSDSLIINARAMSFGASSNTKRLMTGAEIALGVVLVSGAIAKFRDKDSTESPDGQDKESHSQKETDQSSTAFDEAYWQKVISTNAVRATWMVQPADTLVALAEQFYDDARVGFLIADINSNLSHQTYMDGKRIVQLFTRQMIYLPNKEDLQTFFSRKLTDLKPDNLVTIVTEREFDRQLVHMVMNRAMGVPAQAQPQLERQPQLQAAQSVQAFAAVTPDGQINRSATVSDNAENGDHRQPPFPPGLNAGAMTLEGFLSYLRTKYSPEKSAGSTVRSLIPWRYKIEF